MKQIFLLLLLLNCTNVLQADTDAIVFWYEEQEQGAEPDVMRYIVSKQQMRIDNGRADDDFILFDHQHQTVYSINHRDETVMVIKPVAWTAPAFSFSHETRQKTLDDAPRIGGKHVISYQVFAEQTLCADIQLLPDMFGDEMKVFQAYQLTLSGQLIASLHNTPKEYRTPCYLAHQTYNAGEYYALGLPIQEWHERGYVRILKNYSREKVFDTLFSLPQGYKHYSPIGAGTEASP